MRDSTQIHWLYKIYGRVRLWLPYTQDSEYNSHKFSSSIIKQWEFAKFIKN